MSTNLTAEFINQSMKGEQGPRTTLKVRVSKLDHDILAVGTGFLAASTRTSLSIGQAARAALMKFAKSECNDLSDQISKHSAELLTEEVAFTAPVRSMEEIRHALEKYNHPPCEVARAVLRMEMLKQIAAGIDSVKDGEFEVFLDLI